MFSWRMKELVEPVGLSMAEKSVSQDRLFLDPLGFRNMEMF